MKVREPRKRVVIEPTVSNDRKYLVKQETDIADHVLVVGER